MLLKGIGYIFGIFFIFYISGLLFGILLYLLIKTTEFIGV